MWKISLLIYAWCLMMPSSDKVRYKYLKHYTVVASSYSLPVEHLSDSKYQTEWQSNAFTQRGHREHLIIDFNEQVRLGKMAIDWGMCHATHYAVEVDSAGQWVTAKEFYFKELTLEPKTVDTLDVVADKIRLHLLFRVIPVFDNYEESEPFPYAIRELRFYEIK